MSYLSPLTLRGFPCTVDRINDVVYSSPGGVPQLADLYIPREAPRPVPVILFLHAGGWAAWDRRFGPDLSRFFAARGLAMVSIDYRLSSQAIFPAALEDVKSAIRWIGSVAAEYGLDAQRIGVWGLSAGGHLGALAVLSDHFEGVRAVAVGYPPVDFLARDAEMDSSVDGSVDPDAFVPRPGWTVADAKSYESRLLGAPVMSVPELAKKANPALYGRPGAPPFLIAHGMHDVAISWKQSETLYEALRAHGNHVWLHLIEGLGHGFLNRNDFDQGLAKPVRLWEAHPGEEERKSDGPPFTFGTIEMFFKRHLA
jgi:acetyl esterase/lipase